MTSVTMNMKTKKEISTKKHLLNLRRQKYWDRKDNTPYNKPRPVVDLLELLKNVVRTRTKYIELLLSTKNLQAKDEKVIKETQPPQVSEITDTKSSEVTFCPPHQPLEETQPLKIPQNTDTKSAEVTFCPQYQPTKETQPPQVSEITDTKSSEVTFCYQYQPVEEEIEITESDEEFIKIIVDQGFDIKTIDLKTMLALDRMKRYSIRAASRNQKPSKFQWFKKIVNFFSCC